MKCSKTILEEMIRSFYVISYISCFLIQSSVTPIFLNAQVNWGPDVQLTNYLNATAYHPRIVVSQDTLHVVWYEHWADTITNYEVMYKRSTDRGETWTPDTILSPLSPGASKIPDIAVSGSVVHVAWDEEVGDSIMYIRSTNSGREWSPPITLTPAGYTSSVCVSSDTVSIYWGTGLADAYLSTSTDEGVTWLPPRQIPRGQIGGGEMAVNLPFLHIACQGESTGCTEIYYQGSSDIGQTWSLPVMFSEQDIWHSQWPSITADRDSNVYVVWYDYKDSPYAWTGSIFFRRSSDNGVSWDTIQNLTSLYRAKHPDIAALGNDVHVVWMDQRDYSGSPFDSFEIYYRYSSDKGNTWGSETRLTDDPQDSRKPNLAVNPDGVYLIWSDNRDDDSLSYNYEVYFKRGDYIPGVKTKKVAFPSGWVFQIFPTLSRNKVWCYYGFLEPEDWVIEIYDILGRKIRQYAGSRARGKVIWDGCDNSGNRLPSGVYFIKLQAGDYSAIKKSLLIR